MSEHVASSMADHGTRILRPCVPTVVEKQAGGHLNVTWRDTTNGGTGLEEFDTVLMAIGLLALFKLIFILPFRMLNKFLEIYVYIVKLKTHFYSVSFA